MTKVLISLVVAALLSAPSNLTAQEAIHVLPAELQLFAIQNKIYGTLGTAEKVALYVNTLTAIELIAGLRADAMRRSVISDEDRMAAGWVLCVVPWGPPKPEADRARIRSVLPKLVDDALVNAGRRADIVARVNRERIGLSVDELKKQNISPLGVLNVQDIR